MHHRLRFLPLILILAGLALGLALEPNDARAQAGAPATRQAADSGPGWSAIGMKTTSVVAFPPMEPTER